MIQNYPSKTRQLVKKVSTFSGRLEIIIGVPQAVTDPWGGGRLWGLKSPSKPPKKILFNYFFKYLFEITRVYNKKNKRAYILKRETSWNHLEQAGTSWNYLEPLGTRWNHLQRDGLSNELTQKARNS